MDCRLRNEELERRFNQLPWVRHPERPLDEVAEAVKEKAFGQDVHVDRILGFIHLAQERIRRIKEGCDARCLPQLNSMLLMGPTASGKTHVVKTIAHELDMVFYPIESSSLTGEGWSGRSLSWEWANISKIQKEDQECSVLVFLDEIDKLTLEERDHSSFSPKFELLKPLEGGVLKGEGPDRASFEMDCDRCIFIFAGAFTGIEENVSDRLNNSAKEVDLFNTESRKRDYSALDEEKLRALVSLEDVESWGFPRELVGRFSFVDCMSALKSDDLKRVLFEDLLPRYQGMLKNGSINVTDEAANLMVAKAVRHRYGARSLNQQLSSILIRNSKATYFDSCACEVEICVSEDGKLVGKVCDKINTQSDDFLSERAELRDRALRHAVSIRLEIEAKDCEPFQPYERVPSLYEAFLLNRTKKLQGGYSNQEILLLHSVLCYDRDWMLVKESTHEFVKFFLEECCQPSDCSNEHSTWLFDECMQEINSGLKRFVKRDKDGVRDEGIIVSSMVRHAKNDPKRGLPLAECGGLSPENDETLGTYCDFKAFSTYEQKEAVASLLRRLSVIDRDCWSWSGGLGVRSREEANQ